MSAVMELLVYYEGTVKFKDFAAFVVSKDIKVRIKRIEVADSWNFDNHQIVEGSIKDFNFDKHLNDNKIILIKFLLNGIEAGVHVTMVDKNRYELCFFISTDGLNHLDRDVITQENRYLYEDITRELINSILGDKLIAAGIGVEACAKYNSSVQGIVDGCKNIVRWIIPKRKKVKVDAKYNRQSSGNFYIYSLEE